MNDIKSFKRTKILATLGPVTSNPETIKKLALSGVDAFRLNFSHGTLDEKDQQIKCIRQVSNEINKRVAIVEDIQGPKIRLGELKNNINVKAGDILTIDYAAEHDGQFVLPVQYNLAKRVKVGDPVYLFDGTVQTTAIDIPSETAIRVKVLNSGVLMSHKGLNLPDTNFAGDVLTPKDLEDLKFGATKDIDYVASSFIQAAEDINNLRKVLTDLGSSAKIIAKIETKSAIRDENIEEIVKATDGIMVARGDLSVEAGFEVVPVVERKLITLCRKYNKLCIVATQMLMSMVDNPSPSRAEANDVATAVLLGADVTMLSDETANGHYPVEAVSAMNKIISYVQDKVEIVKADDQLTDDQELDALCKEATDLAVRINAKAIIAKSDDGALVNNLSGYKVSAPIIAASSSARIAQQFCLRYGVKSLIAGETSIDELISKAKDEGLISSSDRLVVVDEKNVSIK